MHQVRLEQQVLLGLLERRARRVLQALLVQQELQALLELRGPQGLLVQLGLQVLLERRVQLELQVQRLQVRQE